MLVKWEFYLERGVAPLSGYIEVDGDASDEDILEAIEPEVMGITWSRITWERVGDLTNMPETKP